VNANVRRTWLSRGCEGELMGRLYSYDTAELVRRTAPALEAFQHQDIGAWQRVFDELKLDEPATRSAVPSEPVFAQALTGFVLGIPKKRTYMGEPRPSGFYPHYELPNEFRQSRTWQYLLSDVFCQGKMPDDLWFLYYDHNSVTTNWITRQTMESFLAIEASENMLERMLAAGSTVGPDVRIVVTLFRECLNAGWDIYLFDPGT
jgi:hypothetical protein